MNPKHHKYSPLQGNKIRILHLTSLPDGSPLFHLTHETLTPTLRYQAISYTWGSSIRDAPLLSATLPEAIYVTQNCKLALKNLAATGTTRLWIDAVCINQDDVAERNAQVKLMGRIFRLASRTIAYLGEPDDQVPPVREWMTKHGVGDGDVLQYAENLLARPWNARTWVIQEALLSKYLDFRFGKDDIPFERLVRWNHQLRHETGVEEGGVVALKDAFLEREMDMKGMNRMSQSLTLWRTTTRDLDLISPKSLLNPGYLFDVLCATARYGCQDPRDKVHAVLSLFEKGFPEDIQPNYDRELRELYTNVSRFLVTYGVERVLSAAVGADAVGLPSWAVDWQAMHPETARSASGWYYAFNSSAGWQATTGRHIDVELTGDRAISIVGCRLTQVNTGSLEPVPWNQVKVYDPTDWGMGPGVASREQRKLSSRDTWGLGEATLSGRRSPEEYMLSVAEGGIRSIVPKESRIGDWICMFKGFNLPFVLRPFEERRWRLVGECLVEGFMQGQILKGKPMEEVWTERFVIN